MKMYKYCILVLLLYGCNNPTSSEIPDGGSGGNLTQYSSNIYSVNSGTHIEYVTIDWATYTEPGFIEYILTNQNNENIVTLTDINESHYNIDMPIANFQKIYLNIESESNTIQDSIEIFTRDIKPITNFDALPDNDDWSTLLEWTQSNEIDSIFLNYTVYRLNTLDYNQFNDLESCNCEITVLNDQSTTSYTDDGDFNLGEEYFYVVETNTIQGYGRTSIIQSNLASIDYSCSPIINEDPQMTNASKMEYNKITLNWTHNLNEVQFYEVQIWRSESSDINPLNETLLTTITDYSRTEFSDSYNIGDGTAWFYKIKLIDMHGNEYVTETIMGNSHP